LIRYIILIGKPGFMDIPIQSYNAIQKVHLYTVLYLFFSFQVKQYVSNTEHNSEFITGVAGISQSCTSKLSSISTEEIESVSIIIKLRVVEHSVEDFLRKLLQLFPDYSDLQFYEYFKKLEGRKKI